MKKCITCRFGFKNLITIKCINTESINAEKTVNTNDTCVLWESEKSGVTCPFCGKKNVDPSHMFCD
jgi:hypothetical protein